jgi:hypothetical protein
MQPLVFTNDQALCAAYLFIFIIRWIYASKRERLSNSATGHFLYDIHGARGIHGHVRGTLWTNR